ncbi:MAG TPA: hypothetical protein VGI55_19905 [Solirubrobacteraceae bacterium]|jgi:hypothetical protein
MSTVTRRRFLASVGQTGAVLLLAPRTSTVARAAPDRGSDRIVVRWNEALLDAVSASTLGPPMTARALAVLHTCIYDAWAAYDEHALGTQLGSQLRRPVRERSAEDIRQAISFAAYRALVDLLPASAASIFDPLMTELGYDSRNRSLDASTPAGIGHTAAAAVLEFRHQDGANELGDAPGGIPGVPYSDYTGYVPVNDPMDLRGAFDPATVHDPNAWQPLRYVNGAGALVTPTYVGPQWGHVIGFALDPASDPISAPGPARHGSAEYSEQALGLLNLSAALNDEDKMIAEVWALGPHTVQPPGQWAAIAEFVARRDRHGDTASGMERDVKLFFAIANAMLDASCGAWSNKRAFDSVRPITAIRYLFRGQPLQAWAGPGLGTRTIDGASWLPYQQPTFPTPPFPEYLSGHSTFSAAGAAILKYFTGSDSYGDSVTLPAGSSLVEPGLVPADDLTLSWATFSDAADQAGLSRRYGGIHFERGDLDGRAIGRAAAAAVWEKANLLWRGGEPRRASASAFPRG